MTILSKIDCFKELPFYNVSIEKPKIKRTIKTDRAFSGYARSYEVEIVEKKDPIVQLEAGNLSTKDLFNDLINKIKSIRLL